MIRATMLKSSMGRLMFATVTLAVGITAIRTQSHFWLGSLVVLVAAWPLEAVARAVAARRPGDRARAAGFLAAFIACVLYGFGPWSDVGSRGLNSGIAINLGVYFPGIRHPTPEFDVLAQYVQPQPRALIRVTDGNLGTAAQLDFWAPSGSMEEAGAHLRAATQRLERHSERGPLGTGGPWIMPMGTTGVFMDGCYLLSSLFVGWLVGGVASLEMRRRASRAR